MDKVILVDENDIQIGTAEKMEAHENGGQLHRAFSVFIVDGDRMLLQQRAWEKYHCGGLWTNACCSHPRPGESVADAAARRVREELGAEVADLEELYAFTYRSEFDNGLTEHEFDHVLTASLDSELAPDPAEVAAVRWVSFEDLRAELAASPEAFTPWFIVAAPEVMERLS